MGGEKAEREEATNSKHGLILCGFGLDVEISDWFQC